ncbi:MAG: hypothetical protein ACD_79C00963G0010 [uncultured bacterium]|nr:MAG: hypothetical protein ACD_79C00963G0010 [uncultured bacterium]
MKIQSILLSILVLNINLNGLVFAEENVRVIKGTIVKPPENTNSVKVETENKIEEKPIYKGILISPYPAPQNTTYNQTAHYNNDYYYDDTADDWATFGLMLGISTVFFGLLPYPHHYSHYSYDYHHRHGSHGYRTSPHHGSRYDHHRR